MARFVFLMLDGVGVGELPDAAAYGDVGSDTLGNVSRLCELNLPNLGRLGLGNIIPIRNVPPAPSPAALPGRLAPLSAGKDTTVGHWEHMGLVTARPFPTYPGGFPGEVLGPFTERIGRGVLGNKPASGTAIIEELGEEHLRTGRPIVYTSADSVFQIAAHVDIVPLEQLYEWCETARDILQGEHAVARVIARPFTGAPGAFTRTKDRHDYSLAPSAPVYLDFLQQEGIPVIAVGKISDIYLGRGVSSKIPVGSNEENLGLILDLLRGHSRHATFTEGLLFTNLVDFDMLWGHRNDVDGFAHGLEAVDAALPALLEALGSEDRLLITADHGVDPTTLSTDHSREYVPMLFYPRPGEAPEGVYEGGFADTGATVYAHLTGKKPSLAGRTVTAFEPERGWRPYTAALRPPVAGEADLPGRVGCAEVIEAAHWLREHCGEAPRTAVVLGSGLAEPLKSALGPDLLPTCSQGYDSIPGWRTGGVAGHAGLLEVVTASTLTGEPVLLLEGRVHGYEGYDTSELQLAIRSIAAWGVQRVVLTGAGGGLAPGAARGRVFLVREVLDFHHLRVDGSPPVLEATDAALISRAEVGGAASALRIGCHASVPGPQYETAAENDFLRLLKADTVGMSFPDEIRAAREEGLEVAVLILVTNAGATNHEEVLAEAAAQGGQLRDVLAAILGLWSV